MKWYIVHGANEPSSGEAKLNRRIEDRNNIMSDGGVCFNFSDFVGVDTYYSTPLGRGVRKNCCIVIFVFSFPPRIYSARPVKYYDVDFEITEIIIVYEIVSKCLENNSRTNNNRHILCTHLFVLQYCCIIYECLLCFVCTPNFVACTKSNEELHDFLQKFNVG
jgi:hypothetical protein